MLRLPIHRHARLRDSQAWARYVALRLLDLRQAERAHADDGPTPMPGQVTQVQTLLEETDFRLGKRWSNCATIARGVLPMRQAPAATRRFAIDVESGAGKESLRSPLTSELQTSAIGVPPMAKGTRARQ